MGVLPWEPKHYDTKARWSSLIENVALLEHTWNHKGRKRLSITTFVTHVSPGGSNDDLRKNHVTLNPGSYGVNFSINI